MLADETRCRPPLGTPRETTSSNLPETLFTFISAWGEYLFTYTMEDTASLYTLAVGVAQTEIPNAAFANVPAFSAYGATAAIAIMAAAPALLIFILLQKWFVRGLAEGALKF